MNIIFRYIFIGLLSLFIIGICSCIKKNDMQSFEDNYEQIIDKKIDKLEKENMHLKVKNQMLFIGKDSLNQISLKNFGLPKKLFFYFSANTCSPCIEETIGIIKKTIPNYILDERVVFISPDYPSRFKDNFYGKKILTLEHSKLGIPLEQTEAPFFFVLNNQLEIESVHIVNKTKFFKTEEYLKKIALKL